MCSSSLEPFVVIKIKKILFLYYLSPEEGPVKVPHVEADGKKELLLKMTKLLLLVL